MDIKDYRVEIDRIDKELVRLFCERMEVAAGIGKYKIENNLPVYDSERERQKLNEIAELAGKDFSEYTDLLYPMIFEMSRSYQKSLNRAENPIKEEIKQALETTPNLFPQRPIVACQGVEGAYSQQAAVKMFNTPQIMYFDSFEGVFAAIDNGLCSYGVLPIENSTAGSVKKVYDLMMKYNFRIVRGTRIKIDHSLLALPGTKLSDIKEIFSHEQAIAQSQGFLSKLEGVKITPAANTAASAKMIFESGRKDAAAISSLNCAELYNLNCLETSIQDSSNNHTRFICISKKTEIYPGSDKTSIMMILPHKPGSLYSVLSRFYSLGINLNKLESRPLPNSDFEFMFYFDLEASVYSEEFLKVFDCVEDISVSFKYLGSYLEVI